MTSVVYLASTLWIIPFRQAIRHVHQLMLSFAIPVLFKLWWLFSTRPWWQDFCQRVTKLIVCPTHLRNSTADTTRKISSKCLLILSVKITYIFKGMPWWAELIKLAKMADVRHEANHAYPIRSTWKLHCLAADVPFVACVINLPSIFAYYLGLSNFLLESGQPYFRHLSVCLLFVCFVSAAGCHCFDSFGIC